MFIYLWPLTTHVALSKYVVHEIYSLEDGKETDLNLDRMLSGTSMYDALLRLVDKAKEEAFDGKGKEQDPDGQADEENDEEKEQEEKEGEEEEKEQEEGEEEKEEEEEDKSMRLRSKKLQKFVGCRVREWFNFARNETSSVAGAEHCSPDAEGADGSETTGAFYDGEVWPHSRFMCTYMTQGRGMGVDARRNCDLEWCLWCDTLTCMKWLRRVCRPLRLWYPAGLHPVVGYQPVVHLLNRRHFLLSAFLSTPLCSSSLFRL